MADRAYLKSALPCRGVTSPVARALFREGLAAHVLPDRATWLATVHQLWDDEAVPLYRHLLTTGAWWDVVDDVATHLGAKDRTDPDWVRAFVANHDDRISGLARREALKHLEEV